LSPLFSSTACERWCDPVRFFEKKALSSVTDATFDLALQVLLDLTRRTNSGLFREQVGNFLSFVVVSLSIIFRPTLSFACISG